MTETTPSPLGNVITIDDDRIKSHLERVVRLVEPFRKRNRDFGIVQKTIVRTELGD